MGTELPEAFQPIEILWWGLSVLGLILGVCIMVITGGNMHKPGDDPGHAGYGWKEEERGCQEIIRASPVILIFHVNSRLHSFEVYMTCIHLSFKGLH